MADTEQSAPAASRGRISRLWVLTGNHPVLCASVWTGLLLVLTLAPRQVLPDEQTFSLRRYIPHLDLVVHFALFSGFVVSWLRCGRSWLHWLLIPAVGLLLGAGTEYAQGLPGIDRDPNLLDGLADSAGVFLGLIASKLLVASAAAAPDSHLEHRSRVLGHRQRLEGDVVSSNDPFQTR